MRCRKRTDLRATNRRKTGKTIERIRECVTHAFLAGECCILRFRNYGRLVYFEIQRPFHTVGSLNRNLVLVVLTQYHVRANQKSKIALLRLQVFKGETMIATLVAAAYKTFLQ